MKKIGILLISLFCISCSNGTTIETSAVIVAIEVDASWNGCSHQTVIRTDKGYTDRVCGSYGKVGDNVSGYWTTGHHDNHANGFSFLLHNYLNLTPKETIDE